MEAAAYWGVQRKYYQIDLHADYPYVIKREDEDQLQSPISST